jgi:hypothetical protein
MEAYEEGMLQQSKDKETLDRMTEVASAITEESLRAGGESVPDRLSREKRSQLHAGRQRRGERWRLELDGQPPQR